MTIALLSLFISTFSCSVIAQDTRPALQSDPGGWTDITPAANLNGWTILSLPPGGALINLRNGKWTLKLACSFVREWRARMAALRSRAEGFHSPRGMAVCSDRGGKGYNSGVFVRNSNDGKVWHQAQVGSGSGGFLFGDTLVNGEVKRVNLRASSIPDRVKNAGEWNTYEITCRGNRLSLWTNGTVTSEMPDCGILQGYVGLEAEGYRIEFRNLKLKELTN